MYFTLKFPTAQSGLATLLRKVAIGASFSVLGAFQSASAQWTVFDPTNFARNAITAYESVAATAQRGTAYIAQLKQYQTMLINLKQMSPQDLLRTFNELDLGKIEAIKGVGDLSKLRDIQAIATEAQSVAGAIGNANLSLASIKALQKSLGGLQQAYSQRFEEARRMGLTWEQYAAREDLQIQSRLSGAAARAEEDVARMNNVQKDYEFAQEMAKKIPEAEGVQQSMGIMNAQMNRVVTQLAQLNKGLVSSLNSKTPADIFAEEQQKQTEIDSKRNRISNRQIQQEADEAAIQRYINSSDSKAKK